MTLSDLRQAAEDFLDFYILGSNSPNALLVFPVPFAGIRFRSPAVLGIRPEYTPLPAAVDSLNVASGVAGPEGVGPYLFLDRCPVRKAKVSVQGETVMVELVLVLQYPAGQFPDSTVDPTTEIRLPSDAPNALAMECLCKLEDCIGLDPDVGFPIGYTITVQSKQSFDADPTNG